MTKTQNYQLNQWDAADPIRREDFNADNAAIDAALGEIRPEKVLLKEYVGETAGLTHRVSLDRVDLSRYRKLVIEPAMLCYNSSEYKLYLNNTAQTDSVLMYHNGLSHCDVLAKLQTIPSLNITAVNHFCRVELDLTTPTVFCKYLQLMTYTTSSSTAWSLAYAEGTTLHKTLTPAEITEVTLSSYNSLQAGSTVKIYGVK